MIRICVIGEGQTEEQFVNQVMKPHFEHKYPGISVTANLINTSSSMRGGALNYDRVRPYLLARLKSDQDLIVTTFFDLYALPNNFPKYHEAKQINHQEPYQKITLLENALKDDLAKEGIYIASRFLPYIQPYEFEALLFSDISKLVSVEKQWQRSVNELLKIQRDNPNPELINGGANTHPSARLEKILDQPFFQKSYHGVEAIKRIEFATLLEKCAHFKQWYNKLTNITKHNPAIIQ